MSLIRQIIDRLNTDGVSYVVVGGMAVLLHGRARLTMDLDLVIRLDDENIRKTLRILDELGLKPRLPVNPEDFADPHVRRQWVQERGMKFFSFIDPSQATAGVDIFARYPMDYDQMLSRSVLGNLGGTPVRICSIDDLIEMKRLADRAIDKAKADLEELEIIRRGRTQG